jgi:formate dehydrogenase subunit delta
MSPEKLTMMANQIGRFFAHLGPERAPEEIADHLLKFWDPRMRREIIAFVASGGEGLDPLAAAAVARLAGEAKVS